MNLAVLEVLVAERDEEVVVRDDGDVMLVGKLMEEPRLEFVRSLPRIARPFVESSFQEDVNCVFEPRTAKKGIVRPQGRGKVWPPSAPFGAPLRN